MKGRQTYSFKTPQISSSEAVLLKAPGIPTLRAQLLAHIRWSVANAGYPIAQSQEQTLLILFTNKSESCIFCTSRKDLHLH